MIVLGHVGMTTDLLWYQWAPLLFVFFTYLFIGWRKLLNPKHTLQPLAFLSLGCTCFIGFALFRMGSFSQTEPQKLAEHLHANFDQGQVFMFGDYHAEVVRLENGLFRVWLSSAEQKPIKTTFFRCQLQELNDSKNHPWTPLQEDLTLHYYFFQANPKTKRIKLKIQVPGWTIKNTITFDETPGKRSRPSFCKPPAQYQ